MSVKKAALFVLSIVFAFLAVFPACGLADVLGFGYVNAGDVALRKSVGGNKITRVPKDNPEGKANMVFVFGPGEALGLRLALEHSMGLLAFGIPCARDRIARQ